MPLAKLTCPKCRATLKPAKPVPEGKLIKCPKCAEMFKAAQQPGEGTTAVAAKPETDKKKPATTAYGKPVYDESVEESEGTYTVLKDEEEERKKAERAERERRKERKRRRRARGLDETFDEEDEEDDEDEEEDDENDIAAQYLKNLKPADPRGACQETIVSPANWLLRSALLGFFGWIIWFTVFMIPVAFPNLEEAGKSDVNKGGKFKFNDDVLAAVQDVDLDRFNLGKVKAFQGKEFNSYEDFINQLSKQLSKADLDKVKAATKKFGLKMDKYTHWWSSETILDEDHTPWSVLLFVFVLLLGLAQASVIAIGSMRMQGLESYQWAMTGCIVAMIPLVTFPVFVFISYMVGLSDYLLDGDWAEFSWMIGSIAFLWGPVVGGLCLKQFLQPQVKPGFEYKPD